MKSIPGAAAIGVAASLYAATATAQVTFRTGQDNDIRFRWAVPESSASSGSGDVFFQLDAPDTYSWVGLGIGSRMRGAEIFLMYQDGDGNVTLSTREGEGHLMPVFSERSGVELIEGSGVRGSRMVASVRCGDCGSLDLGGENSWIAAWGSGDPLDSADVREPIGYHDGRNIFSVDFAQARISSGADPFPDTGSDDSGSEDDDRGTVTQSGGDGDKWDTIIMAHGIIMSVVFLVLYPVGSMLMPLLGKWLIHAGFQAIAFLLMWAGFACGYMYANHGGDVFAHTHTRMGVSVVALLAVQPVLGYLHHRHFLKHRRRGVISHIHIWYGRVLMALGIVTGGLGLALAGETFDGAFAIAHTAVAAALGVAYIAAAVWGIVKRRRSGTSSSEDSLRVKG